MAEETKTLLLATMIADEKEEDTIKMYPQDIQHFKTSLEDRRNCIIKTLKLDNNKLIDSEQKLEKVTELFFGYWGVLDINGDRLAKFKSQKKIEIITHGPPVASKTRFVNPVLAETVKEKFNNG